MGCSHHRLLAMLGLTGMLFAGCGGGGGDAAIDVSGAGSGLQTSATRGAIEARIVTAAGAPVAGQTVTVSGVASRQDSSLTVTTNSQGVARIGNLPPGTYTLLVDGVSLTAPVAANAITTRWFNLGNPSQPRNYLGLMYVVNALAKTLSVVDVETGAVQNNVLNTGESPNQVVFRNGVGYLVNSVSNNIQMFNPFSHTTTGTIDIGENTNPWAIAFASDTKAYVSNLVANNVAVVDLVTGTVTGTIPTTAGPEGILVHNGKLYVCCTNFSFADFSYGVGQVVVIDTATDQVLSTIPLEPAANPPALALGADGLLYVVATGDFATVGTRIFRIDPATDQVVGQPLALTSPGAGFVTGDNIAVAADGRGFVNDFSNNRIHVIDTTNGTVIATGADAIQTGSNPLGVAVSPNGRVWSLNFGDDTLTAYDGPTLAQVGTAVNVGDGPLKGETRGRGSSGVGLAVR